MTLNLNKLFGSADKETDEALYVVLFDKKYVAVRGPLNDYAKVVVADHAARESARHGLTFENAFIVDWDRREVTICDERFRAR